MEIAAIDPKQNLAQGIWHHPLYSSILYLDGGGAPTLIINQTRGAPLDPDAAGALITPETGQVRSPAPPDPRGFWTCVRHCVSLGDV